MSSMSWGCCHRGRKAPTTTEGDLTRARGLLVTWLPAVGWPCRRSRIPPRTSCIGGWPHGPANAGRTWPRCGCATGPVSPKSTGSCPTARPCKLCRMRCADRLRRELGFRDLPGQPRRLRGQLPAQRVTQRHSRTVPRLRLRPLPQRPDRLDLRLPTTQRREPLALIERPIIRARR
jgi:hypothetical protein